MTIDSEFTSLLTAAVKRRAALFGVPETNAFRVFNGFYEGAPALCIDKYAETAVLLRMSKREQLTEDDIRRLTELCLERIPGTRSVLFKDRFAADDALKKGIMTAGGSPAASVREWGTRYPVDLRLNKDCGFYLDSALLRRWLLGNAAGKRVLNTFAYTGSLGMAAAAGKAAKVTQTDLNPNYLKETAPEIEYITGDFFRVTAALRRAERLFDILILDPPFFANARRSAKIDTARDITALVNKIRPLAADGSRIIVVNNALFLSGAAFMERLESLCGDYLSVSGRIPVPESFFGYAAPEASRLPADPAPFNHSTKIAILEVRRKDGRR